LGVAKLFVANWKMEASFEQQCILAHQYVEELSTIGKELVLCPSFDALESVQKIITVSPLKLGAQGCSPYLHGPYTGQVSAESLTQVGCTYTIIGHSEWRTYTHETYEVVAKQYEQLVRVGITPIVCVGEAKHTPGVHQVIHDQLKPILSVASNTLYIAYEPLWAIGTGLTPTIDYLQNVYSTLTAIIPSTIQRRVLYGGSVNPITIKELNLPELDGFLIGRASLNVQNLKKIVSYS
jgi:triosephosphate isomerase (TIM)